MVHIYIIIFLFIGIQNLINYDNLLYYSFVFIPAFLESNLKKKKFNPYIIQNIMKKIHN